MSDITYLRMVGGGVYLTVVLDLYDRRVTGWALSVDGETAHTTIPALNMAYANRTPREGLIFHSDREAVAAMSPYAKMAAGAAAVIAPCANLNAGAAGNPEDTWWVQDLSAATENILLQIIDEGLGGVWLGWYPDQKRVKAFSETFGLPPHIIPFSLVALGYPSGTVKKADRFDPSRVFYGRYGCRSPCGKNGS